MSDNLFENYNPLYDVHLRQYFASPHMQKHLREIGLLDKNASVSGADEDSGHPSAAKKGNTATTNENTQQVYTWHRVMMDMMLRNRERVFAQLADLHKKLDAAEKVEICRRIRSGLPMGADLAKASHMSRSLSRPARGRTKRGVAADEDDDRESRRRRRHHSNSCDDSSDTIRRIEADYKSDTEAAANPRNIYNRLAASVYKYQYLHKLDDRTLQNYKESLRKQLQKLERFRELSFGQNSVARHPPSNVQSSWFFRRRSLPSISAPSQPPANTLLTTNHHHHIHQVTSSPRNSKNTRKSRVGKSQSPRKTNPGEVGAMKTRSAVSRSRAPPPPQSRLPPLPKRSAPHSNKFAATSVTRTTTAKTTAKLPPPTATVKPTIKEKSDPKLQQQTDVKKVLATAGSAGLAAATALVSVMATDKKQHDEEKPVPSLHAIGSGDETEERPGSESTVVVTGTSSAQDADDDESVSRADTHSVEGGYLSSTGEQEVESCARDGAITETLSTPEPFLEQVDTTTPSEMCNHRQETKQQFDQESITPVATNELEEREYRAQGATAIDNNQTPTDNKCWTTELGESVNVQPSNTTDKQVSVENIFESGNIVSNEDYDDESTPTTPPPTPPNINESEVPEQNENLDSLVQKQQQVMQESVYPLESTSSTNVVLTRPYESITSDHPFEVDYTASAQVTDKIVEQSTTHVHGAVEGSKKIDAEEGYEEHKVDHCTIDGRCYSAEQNNRESMAFAAVDLQPQPEAETNELESDISVQLKKETVPHELGDPQLNAANIVVEEDKLKQDSPSLQYKEEEFNCAREYLSDEHLESEETLKDNRDQFYSNEKLNHYTPVHVQNGETEVNSTTKEVISHDMIETTKTDDDNDHELLLHYSVKEQEISNVSVRDVSVNGVSSQSEEEEELTNAQNMHSEVSSTIDEQGRRMKREISPTQPYSMNGSETELTHGQTENSHGQVYLVRGVDFDNSVPNMADSENSNKVAESTVKSAIIDTPDNGILLSEDREIEETSVQTKHNQCNDEVNLIVESSSIPQDLSSHKLSPDGITDKNTPCEILAPEFHALPSGTEELLEENPILEENENRSALGGENISDVYAYQTNDLIQTETSIDNKGDDSADKGHALNEQQFNVKPHSDHDLDIHAVEDDVSADAKSENYNCEDSINEDEQYILDRENTTLDGGRPLHNEGVNEQHLDIVYNKPLNEYAEEVKETGFEKQHGEGAEQQKNCQHVFNTVNDVQQQNDYATLVHQYDYDDAHVNNGSSARKIEIDGADEDNNIERHIEDVTVKSLMDKSAPENAQAGDETQVQDIQHDNYHNDGKEDENSLNDKTGEIFEAVYVKPLGGDHKMDGMDDDHFHGQQENHEDFVEEPIAASSQINNSIMQSLYNGVVEVIGSEVEAATAAAAEKCQEIVETFDDKLKSFLDKDNNHDANQEDDVNQEDVSNVLNSLDALSKGVNDRNPMNGAADEMNELTSDDEWQDRRQQQIEQIQQSLHYPEDVVDTHSVADSDYQQERETRDLKQGHDHEEDIINIANSRQCNEPEPDHDNQHPNEFCDENNYSEAFPEEINSARHYDFANHQSRNDVLNLHPQPSIEITPAPDSSLHVEEEDYPLQYQQNNSKTYESSNNVSEADSSPSQKVIVENKESTIAKEEIASNNDLNGNNMSNDLIQPNTMTEENTQPKNFFDDHNGVDRNGNHHATNDHQYQSSDFEQSHSDDDFRNDYRFSSNNNNGINEGINADSKSTKMVVSTDAARGVFTAHDDVVDDEEEDSGSVIIYHNEKNSAGNPTPDSMTNEFIKTQHVASAVNDIDNNNNNGFSQM